MDDLIIEGGCACGAVRFTATGEPRRVGLCHCMTCRKAHSAAFNPFIVFTREQVVITGELREWASSESYHRNFCPRCGSRVFGATIGSDEVEISIGSLDEPGHFSPQYESWVIRREPWLAPLPVTQNERDPA